MQMIYRVEGVLNKGFQGHISYMVSLPATFQRMDIDFSFEPQYLLAITDEIKAALVTANRRWLAAEPDEKQLEHAARCMKTEINITAWLNGRFIGGIHRQLARRHMVISADEATEGAIPVASFSGVLRVDLIVFNVLYDQTTYELIVMAGERDL